MSRLFGTDGVRGVANDSLTPQFAFELGQAVCECLKDGSKRPMFIIGCDTRLSSPMLHNAITSGIMSRGGAVISVGVMTTPAIAVLTKHYGGDCGVVISASHNPYYDNGIKFFNACGMKLSDSIEDKIQKMLEEHNKYGTCINGEVGTMHTDNNAKESYCEHIFSVMPHSDLAGLKVVIDCANGAASKIAPAVFERLNADLTVINDKPNGININDSCGSTHTQALCDKVIAVEANIGLAFDGDADRLIACDEKGSEINGDRIMYLFAKYLHEQGLLHDDTLVISVMSNLGLIKKLAEGGVKTAQTQVGDRYIIQEMLEKNYNLGGEQSGHIILSDYNPTGDGIAAAMLLTHIVKTSGKPLSELLAGYRDYPQILVNVKMSLN